MLGCSTIILDCFLFRLGVCVCVRWEWVNCCLFLRYVRLPLRALNFVFLLFYLSLSLYSFFFLLTSSRFVVFYSLARARTPARYGSSRCWFFFVFYSTNLWWGVLPLPSNPSKVARDTIFTHAARAQHKRHQINSTRDPTQHARMDPKRVWIQLSITISMGQIFPAVFFTFFVLGFTIDTRPFCLFFT